MNLKTITISFILILSSFLGFAQTNLDSLWDKYYKTESDTGKISILNEEIGYTLENMNPDSAINIYKIAITLSEKNIEKSSTKNDKTYFLNCKATSLRYIGIVLNNQSKFKEALTTLLDALTILMENQNFIGQAFCFNNLGDVYENMTKYDIAITNYKKSAKIFKDLNKQSQLTSTYNSIGDSYYSSGKYNEALDYFFKAIKINETIDNKLGLAYNFTNIGNIYSIQKEYLKAIDYYKKALSIAEQNKHLKLISACYNNLGSNYENINDIENALKYYLLSLKIKEETNDIKGIASSSNNIASIFELKGEFSQALEYYHKSLKLNKSSNDFEGLTVLYNNMADFYCNMALSQPATKKQFNFQKALEYANHSKRIADSLSILPRKKMSAYTLMNIFKSLGDIDNAFRFANQYIILNDSLFSIEKTQAIADAETKFETEKKQLQIEKLNKEKELDKQVIITQNERNKKQQIITFSITGGLAIILLFSVLLLRLYFQKKKANYLLSSQNIEIQQKNEEITSQRDEIESQRDQVTIQKKHIETIHKDLTDSINYAERIQRSFMATNEVLKAHLKDYFVFFRPKDVVSGDFYWAGKLSNGNFALVTADCTGHGVPGAIMSILIITAIEKAVEQNICEPSEILNFTRKTIIERLKKDGSIEGGKDGMDASLICFDFEKSKMDYSAANNPIWVIRNHEIIELLPDKMPVGKHDKDNIPFTQTSFSIEPGDEVICLTDGFPDQFGGPHGKKFKYKPLKQLLLDNCHESLKEQKNHLDTIFVEWKGNLEQVDDVTIMGIKI